MRALLLVIAGLKLLAASVTGVCPVVDQESLLTDPAVDAAMQQAWADTAESTDHEKEQGGFIYQCSSVQPDGSFEWETVVERWPDKDATDHSIAVPPQNSDPSCHLVGFFHTHPQGANDPVKGKPGWVHNGDKPSDADMDIASQLGVPGLVGWGKGDKMHGVTGFGPGEAATPCPGDTNQTGGSSGDPHLLTFDGLAYDLQTTGEFVLVRSLDGSLEVQTRQVPVAGNELLSGNTAVALKVDGSVVEIAGSEIAIDGERRPLGSPEETTLAGGGSVSGSSGSVTVTWADGTTLQFLGRSVLMSLAEARRGQVSGLLGDGDGELTDDLVAGGALLYADRKLTREEVYGQLAPAWQVTADTSLFTYQDGQGPGDFIVEGFPQAFITVDHLEPAVRRAAERRCRERGVEDPTQLAGCVLDVAVSGDDSWADEAGAVAEALQSFGPAASPELVQAAGQGDLLRVQALVEGGAPIDGRDDQGRTALHWAVVAGDAEVVAALLAAGADVGISDGSGRTALHNAAFWGFEDIARSLEAAGASTAATDDSDQTPADLARQQGHVELAEELS